ncbi:Cyclic di-GMP phosphodiesterase Gmr [Marinomonas spartinae]|uniref:Cyclic di-GMP phosphodiesterase Gmr n=1 Tax=Marinomonas spartinae TaxID=1792290 RepID=A0A1A8TLD5_9GAMM|nr:diguanylate cyclase [Marinomonas spartinae]SBS33869.1 Cyclic di-GMP phosphodiesterase Gmr [Marinomonas spartinae]
MLLERDYQSLAEHLPRAMIIYGADGHVCFYNSLFFQEWLAPSIVAGCHYSINRTQIKNLYHKILQPIAENQPTSTSQSLYQKDYLRLHDQSILRLNEFSIDLEDNNHVLVELWEDVSKEYALLNEVREEHHLLLSLINSIPDQVYLKDLESKFILINPSLAKRYGVKDTTEAIGKSDADFYSNEHASITRQEELNIIRTQKGVYNKLHHEKWHDSHDTWNLSTKLPLKNSKNEVIGIIGISHDVTEYKLNQDKYWKQANFDKLTGLSNRQHLTSEFDRIAIECRQNNENFVFLLLDLDGFKQVNDSYGHGYGDLLLAQVSERLKNTLRQRDLICRLGGDEFVVISAPIKDQPVAEKIAEKIIQCFERPFVINHRIAHITTSMGIVFTSALRVNLHDVQQKADHAMYKAKKAGKNRYRFYNQAIAVESKRHDFLCQELKITLEGTNSTAEKDEFSLEIALLEDLKTGVKTKEQGIYSWQHPQLGRISAEELLSTAESTGNIVCLEANLISKAINTIEKEIESFSSYPNYKPRRISMPISQAILSQPDLLASVLLPIVEKHPMAMRGLLFEVPAETVYSSLPNSLVSQSLKLLDSYGSSLVLSHVTGQSLSIQPLIECQISRINLAESLVQNAYSCDVAKQSIKTLCAMAHALDIKVVAKGIETNKSYRCIKSLGCCDYGQGDYIDRQNDTDISL